MSINWFAWIVFLHVAFAFVFVFAHGASASVAFKLRGETNLERIRALLELSTDSYGVMYLSLLGLLVAGLVAGFIGNLWDKGWIWTSLVVLILIAVLMSVRGSSYYGALRKASGLPFFENWKSQPAIPALNEDEIAPLLKSGRPFEVAVIGGLGLVVLLWLMMFKPF